jgi:hypothetical protein
VTRRVRVKNAADEAQVAEGERLDHEELKQRRADVRRVLQTPEGYRVFRWLLDETNPDRDPVGRDPYGTYRNLGYFDFGRTIRAAVVEADVEMYLKLHKEIVHG